MATPAAASTQQVHRRRDWWFVRYGCLLVLVGVFFLCMLVSAFVATDMFMNGPAIAAFAFVLATSTAVPYGVLLLWFDRNEQEPLLLVLTAFMWGALVATAISLVVNTAFGVAVFGFTQDEFLSSQLTASVSAPFIEELTKGAAVMFLFFLFRRDFDNVLDGMLYGALVGLGFAWFENALYYVRAGEGGIQEMLKLTYLRGFLNGISSHVAYTGLTGLGFGLVRVLRKGVLRWGFVPLFWGMAMFAHFLWNTFVGPLIYATGARDETVVYLVSLPLAVLVLQSPFVLLLFGVALLVWRHERRLIGRYLRDEQLDIVKPEEVVKLVPARRRLWYGLKRFLTEGPLAWLRHRFLEQDLIKLAFVKWHHDLDEHVTWSADQDADVLALRDRIARRRARMAAP